jgi:hypothetical protein
MPRKNRTMFISITEESLQRLFLNLHRLNNKAFAKTHRMAKQKFRPTRLGVFSGEKAYIQYVEVLKKRHNAAGRTFCDAIKH